MLGTHQKLGQVQQAIPCLAVLRNPAGRMQALPRRLLGNTGLNVSVIGFGASPLGGVFQV